MATLAIGMGRLLSNTIINIKLKNYEQKVFYTFDSGLTDWWRAV